MPNDTADVTPPVERESSLVADAGRRSREVIGAIGEARRPLPAAARQTITSDRGTEFLSLERLAERHGIDPYSCDTRSPRRKGGVENANGRPRRFLPGELDPATLTATALRAIEDRMSGTPRECLWFRTPHEVFAAAVG